jgi:DNA-binding transcriptional ArsR family regulator
MSFSKANEFHEYSQYLALICKSLSHPARIFILNEIIKSHGDGVDFTALADKIPLAQSTISQHLAYLRKMDIIQSDSPKRSRYKINEKMVNTIVQIFQIVVYNYKKTPKSILKELETLSKKR